MVSRKPDNMLPERLHKVKIQILKTNLEIFTKYWSKVKDNNWAIWPSCDFMDK